MKIKNNENETAVSKRKHKIHYRKGEIFTGYLFALPWIIGFLLFTAYPIFSSFYLSFTNYRLSNVVTEYIGILNYKNIFTLDTNFTVSLLNTLEYVGLSVPIFAVASLCIALLLNTKVHGVRLYRTFFYLPTLVSSVAVALLWKWIFNPMYGPINGFLGLFGIEGPGWLSDHAWAIPSLVLMGTWSIGTTVVIILASLTDLPEEVYEAARIDGAGIWRRFYKLTLPFLSPVLYFNILMSIISGFQVFTQAYIMTGGGPGKATLFYALVIYDTAFQQRRMGYACAYSWILMVIIFIVTLLAMKIGNKAVFYADNN